MPLSLGGLGLRSASRLSESAFWASWADCMEMIRHRHPEVAGQLVDQLEGFPDTPVLEAAAAAARSLTGVMGFAPHGTRWQQEPDPNRSQRSLRSAKAVGSMRLRPGLTECFVMLISSVSWTTQSSPCCVHRVAQKLAWQCPRAPPVASQGWNLNCSEFSSCVVCSFPSP